MFLTTFSYAQTNHSLTFDGKTDYIEVPHHKALNIASNQTVEVWVKPDTSTGAMILVRKGWCNSSDDGYYVGIQSGKVNWIWAPTGNCLYNAQVQTIDSVIPTGVCSHIAVVHRPDTVLIYVNGKKVRSKLLTGRYSTINSNSQPITMGSYRWKSGGYGGYFKGEMDEVRIWNIARSQKEIENTRNRQLRANDSSLVAYYTMEDSITKQSQVVTNKSYLKNALNGKTIGTTSSPFRDTSCVSLTYDTCNYDDSTFIDTVVACNYYRWVNGKTYYRSTSGQSHTLYTANGCDSLVKLHLTIHRSTYQFDTIYACDSFTWIDGKTYYESNYSSEFVDTSQYGCVSVLRLQLTITKTTDSVIKIDACDSFTWVNGKTYYHSTDTPVYKYISSFGCDSFVRLNLTIHKETYGIDQITACDSFTWINGKTYYSSVDTPIYYLTGQYGCDSLVTLHLTINRSVIVVDTVMACDSFRWIDGLTYFKSTDTASYTTIASNGCDSVVQLNLTINHSTSTRQKVKTCGAFTWIDGKTYTSSISGPTITLTDQHGCDSTVILDLTIELLDAYVVQRYDTLLVLEKNANYQWFECKSGYQKLVSDTNRYFVPQKDGNYAVVITRNTCIDTSDCYKYTKVGSRQMDALSTSISVYPNPSHGLLWLESEKALGTVKIQVFDVVGVMRFESAVNLTDGRKRVDLNNLEAGHYHLVIESDNGQLVSKIILSD